MYQVLNGHTLKSPSYFPDVFLFGDEGIPLQGNRIINRFVNFKDDQLLTWLMQHENRSLSRIGGVTLPLYGDWSSNFWHWCCESLPVALAAHDGGFTGSYLVPDIPFAADTLKLLGIRPDRILTADGGDYFLECMSLLGKRRGSDPATLPALSRIRTALRHAFAGQHPERRLYVSRNGNPDSMRKIVNEPGLLELLERFGFVKLHMEELSLEEQLACTCNASVLLGPHGAGMTHCTFMPEKSLVLELFAPSYVNPCLIPVCRLLEHRYFQITSPCCHQGYQYGQDIDPFLEYLELTLARELR